MADRLLNNEVDTINVGNVDNDIRDSYTRSMIAELEPSSVASKHHLENTFFIQDSDRYLYKCLQEINIGDTLTVGVNVARYDISNALYELYAQSPGTIRNVISNVETGSTASRNFAQGECILWTDGNLYEVSTSVTLGTTWTVGTNISLVPNVTDYIKSLADTTYNTGDSAETDIADGDYFPFYDTSATNKKKTLWSTIVSKLKSIFLVSTIESSLQAASMGSTAGRQYAVGLDSDGKMSVNVPWEDHNTTYSVTSKTAAGLAPQLPNETTTTKYLRQDGTWQVPPDTNTWRGIQDNLSSDSAVDSLSAKQGKALNTGKAPTSHNSTGTGYGVGNASYYGHVKLSDTYTSNVGAAANAIGASQTALYNVWKGYSTVVAASGIGCQQLGSNYFIFGSITVNNVVINNDYNGTLKWGAGSITIPASFGLAYLYNQFTEVFDGAGVWTKIASIDYSKKTTTGIVINLFFMDNVTHPSSSYNVSIFAMAYK